MKTDKIGYCLFCIFVLINNHTYTSSYEEYSVRKNIVCFLRKEISEFSLEYGL